MNEREVITELRQFVGREILKGQDQGLDENTRLLELGILESLSMVTLINFIEENWSVVLTDDDRAPTNFETLTATARLVVRLSQPA